MITALAKDVVRTVEYLDSMNILEKLVIKNDELVSKLKLTPNTGKTQVINEHLSNQRHFGPRFVFKKSLYCVIVGAFISTIMLLTKLNEFADTKETGCAFYIYIPLYILAFIIVFLSILVSIGVRNVNDPYFLKGEFVIVIGIVVPTSILLNVIIVSTPAMNYHGVSILFLIVGSHFVSVVVPNVIAFRRNRKSNNKRSVSINSLEISNLELRKKAAERFCLELAFFMEDYESFKVLHDKTDIEIAFMNLISKYFERNAPQELSISENLKKQVMLQYRSKDYEILDKVHQEVRTTLYQNITLT